MTTLPALEIARQASLRPIVEIAGQMGLPPELLEHYGAHVAKISLDAVSELADRPTARYVVVTAITPTPLGEGKTTTTVGLGQALALIGKQATIAIRQASMGPTFGIKGGAAGGGYSQVVPFENLNLHLTGDLHAVTAANNLLAAMVDNHVYAGNELDLDPHGITWKRVLDVNDRSLRDVVSGLGGRQDGLPRQTGFDITAASEVMAVLALSRTLQDLRARFGRIVVGYTEAGDPVTAEQLKAAGAMLDVPFVSGGFGLGRRGIRAIADLDHSHTPGLNAGQLIDGPGKLEVQPGPVERQHPTQALDDS